MGLLTSELRKLIGTKRTYVAPEPFGAASGRYFALAVGDNNPIYRDLEAAKRAGLDEITLPPTLICETNQYSDRPMDSEGYSGHTWGIEIPDTRTVRGGNTYQFFRRVSPKVRVHVVWELVALDEKESSSGADMLIVTSQATYRDQDGDLLAKNGETVIFIALEGDR